MYEIKNEKQEHTALPWDAIKHSDEAITIGRKGAFLAVAKIVTAGLPIEAAEANAALIVRAVNSHHAMLEALEALTTACEIADNKEDRPDDIGGELLTKARAAIQLGRG